MPAPKVRDVRKLADSRAVFELDIPLEDLPGYPAEYLPGGGFVHARLVFGREQGFAIAQVTLQGQLVVTCQRCLGPTTLLIDSSSPVLIVESEQEAQSAPAGWETFLAPEGRVVFEALVAEELLLALPIVPLHADEHECGALAEGAPLDAAQVTRDPSQRQGAGAPSTVRPFADLRALLERGTKGQ